MNSPMKQIYRIKNQHMSELGGQGIWKIQEWPQTRDAKN